MLAGGICRVRRSMLIVAVYQKTGATVGFTLLRLTMIDSTWLSVMPISMLLMLAVVELLFAPAQAATATHASSATARREFDTACSSLVSELLMVTDRRFEGPLCCYQHLAIFLARRAPQKPAEQYRLG